MGNTSLLLAAAAFVTFGVYYGASTQAQLFGAQEGAAEKEYAVLARNAALSGFERAKQHLADDFTSTSIQGTLDDVRYDVTVAVSGDTASVVAHGRFDDPQSVEDVVYRVRGTFRELTASTTPPLPPYLSYGILAGGNFSMGGTGDVFDASAVGSSAIARIHSNGQLNVTGGAANAQAFGTYVDRASNRAARAFNPLYNPDGLPTVYQAAEEPIPTVIAADIAAAFGGGVVVPANGTLSGLLPGGTREAPVVYHGLGRLSLNNVRFDGYAVVTAAGDITVGSEATGTGGVHDGQPESALALYTEGSVRLSGNSRLYAQVIANNTLSYSGTVDIYGSVVTGNVFSLRGTGGVHYIPASPGLAWEGRGDGRGGSIMATYSEY